MSNLDLEIVILGAGKGTRMKSQTPKVLHKICGKSMISHTIEESLKITEKVTIIIGHQAEKVKSQLQSEFDNLNFIEQDLVNFSGTGGALKNFKASKKNVLVLNGDMPLVDKNELEKFTQAEYLNSDISLAVFNLENPTGYGRIILDQNNQITGIVEQKDATEDQLKIKTVNAGVYLFKKEILDEFIPRLSNNNAQQEYYLTDLISLSKEQNKIIKPIYVTENKFSGVNSKVQLAEAEKFMLNDIRENHMKNGVIFHLPETVYIEKSVKFIGECEIEPNVSIFGDTEIENSKIRSGSVIEDSKIANTKIGPMAHIRPKSVIRDSAIGNFVEVKKSELNGVKAGHLSYIGDAEIDEGTNIGAGFITCNYDGKSKYKTKIGKNVFVGSDSQIVAPMTIENNVIIASGTTVAMPKNNKKIIPSGSLVIARTPVKLIQDFFYRFFNFSNKQ
jgi:bifunctional UDP-N-acetylglucosamine pyrophosphorylase/glucosamine-1-phosphate N-acetyltransferase